MGLQIMLLKFISKRVLQKHPSFVLCHLSGKCIARLSFSRIVFCFSKEEADEGNQQSELFRFKKVKRKGQQQRTHSRETDEDKPDLTRLLRAHRNRIDQGGELSDYVYGLKKIASHYKRQIHQEFTSQKEQLQKILQSIAEISLGSVKFEEYLYLLDFLRAMDRVETISRFSYEKAKNKLANHLEVYIQKISERTTQDLLLLYTRVGQFNFTFSWKIGLVLHDRLADVFNEKGKLQFSMMQKYIFIKSLSKRNFLSYIDKKILEMILLTLKKEMKEIDSNMILKLANAIKNCHIKANISDHQIYSISDQILGRAVEIISKGIRYSQMTHFLQTEPSDNPFFKQIFTHLYQKTIKRIQKRTPETIKITPVQTLIAIVKHLRPHYSFSSTDRQVVIQYLDLLQSTNTTLDKKTFNLVLLQLLRYDFFGRELDALTALIKKTKIQVYFSFPLEYSYRNVPFPTELVEPKIKSRINYRFQTNHNYLKMAVSVALQSALQPNSEVLATCHKAIIQQLTRKNWSYKQTEWMVRQSVQDPQLVRRYHLLYSQYYFASLIPSPQQISRDGKLQKGEKSSIFKFWEYVLVVCSYGRIPYELIQQIPNYAIFLVIGRQLNVKNVQPDAKMILLLAILLKLRNQRIRLNSSDGSTICNLLLRYEPILHQSKESIVELYCQIIFECLKYYEKLEKNMLATLNFLISKLLVLDNKKITNSQYLKRLVSQLLQNESVLNKQNESDYFKTTVIRFALNKNLISSNALAKMQWNYFTKMEQQMVQAITQEFRIQQWTASSFVSYLKMSRPSSNIAQEIQQINNLIDTSTLQQLEQYLLHFSWGRGTHSDNILVKIVEQFMRKGEIRNVDIVGILKNIQNTLKGINPSVFQWLLIQTCEKLSKDPTTHFLVDHLQILSIILQNSTNSQKYQQTMLTYIRQSYTHASVTLQILYQLTRKGHTISLSDLSLFQNDFIINPEVCLKIAVLNQSTLSNWHQFSKTVIKHTQSPLKQSIYCLFLQKTQSLSFAKQKNAVSVLKKANELSSQLFKLLQSNEIDVVHQQKWGEHIYFIKDKVTVVFVDLNCVNQNKFIQTTLKQLYPDRQLLLVSAQTQPKDLSALLDTLSSYYSSDSSRVKFIGEEICVKIRGQLNLV